MEVNNPEFWDRAYRVNAPVLLGVLRRYVKDVSIAQDLLHEVFVTAIDKYDGYTGKGSFEGWLYRIAVNVALMYLRNERNNPVETWRDTSLLPVIDDADRQSDNVRVTIETAGFSSEDLLSAIDCLPEHHKMVFNMYVMDDFSHKQIGAELNISPGTSKSHLARARKKIQQLLYDDAMNRKKKKDKRRASAFWLLFPAGGHYIDSLFRKGLSDFTLPPSGGTEFLSVALSETRHISPLLTATTQTATTFFGSKLSYVAVCCCTAAITSTVCWVSMSKNSPLNRDYETKVNKIFVIDTLKYLPGQIDAGLNIFNAADNDGRDVARHVSADTVGDDGKDMARHVSADTLRPAVPVTVKKQIIEHQTVVIRDTIFIIE